jgi:hypothetical protein
VNPTGAQRPSLLVAVAHAALPTSDDAVDASEARKDYRHQLQLDGSVAEQRT